MSLRFAGCVAFALLGCASAAPPPLPQPPKQSGALFAPAAVSATSSPSPPSAPVAASKPSVAAAPASLPAVSLGDIGSGGPVEVLAASTSAAWVALCEGEPATARLIIGSGNGEPIDRVEAADPKGRYVIVTHEAVTSLIDTITSARVDLTKLGADLRRVRADYAPHRSLSFDPSGTQLAYVRRGPRGSEIVLRKLVTGDERVLSAGAGEIFRIAFSNDGRYLTLEALRADTSGNGKLDWPAPEESSVSSCGPKKLQFRSFSYQGRGDALTRAVLSLNEGTLRDVPDLVTPLGTSLLVRGSDGSLQLDTAGRRRALVPSSCAARVVFADADRGLVLATCQPPKKKGKATPATGKAELWLFGAGLAKNLQVELYETGVDRDATSGARLVPVYPGSASALLDLERRELLPLDNGSRVLSVVDTRALIWRGNELSVFDAVTKSEQPLARGVHKNPDLLRAGSTVLLSPFVVIGAAGPALEGRPGALAVSESGHALVPASAESATGPAPSPSGIRGPLHWLDARLPPSDGPPR